MTGLSLNDILENENVELIDVVDNQATEEREQSQNAEQASENFCVECKDMPSQLNCVECDENFCNVCYAMIHGSGKRKTHHTNRLEDESGNQEDHEMTDEEKSKDPVSKPDVADDDEYTDAELAKLAELPSDEAANRILLQDIKQQAQYVPLRLTAEERQLFNLLDAALNVSEYTDKIDIFSYTNKNKRIVSQLKEICSILLGLVVSKNMKLGSEMVVEKNFKDHESWFKNIFEIGRRYKILNPNRFNDNFGKLIYMIMDSRKSEVKSHMEFDLYKPIKTVHRFLDSREDKKALGLFEDTLLVNATAEIQSRNKTRKQIDKEIKIKEYAIEKLANKYCSTAPVYSSLTESETEMGFTKEEIRQVLYSIGDVNAFINANKLPVNRLLTRLTFFEQPETKCFDLGIYNGVDGSRLTHSHEKQYEYVNQSLSLWCEIMKQMIYLWSLADDDLLSDNGSYRLCHTGQGMNRVKSCPKVYRAMLNIVEKVKRQTGYWIGSSYIHLGDETVPNALFFLDKYLQVPKILNPIDTCLHLIEEEFPKDQFLTTAITNEYESIDNLVKLICHSFFRKAFNGSGANDYFSAGSCVDGRLTSTWEWANQIHKYDFYKFFLLTGFTGFNG